MATSSATRRSRALQLFIVGVLAAALLPIAPARASHVTARSTDDACKDAPEDGFTDTGADGTAMEEAVDCISWYGVTTGTSAKTYSPGATISRAQMATMIANVMRASEKNFAEPNANEDFFGDDETSPHEKNINFVAKHGVVKGTGAGAYSPGSPVLRDQMATFIANQLEAIGADVPTATQNYFTDDNGNTHEANINSLAALGIATGRTEGQYFPRTKVTRGQMAFFISRDLDYLVDEELMTVPEGDAPAAAAGTHESVDVFSVDGEKDSFVGQTDAQGHGKEQFDYDNNDTFELAGTFSNEAITMAEFEGLLSGPLGDVAGDVLDIEYAPGGKSAFVVDTDNIPLTKPVASVVNLDGGTTINDVVITWEGSQPDATYDVYRDAEQVPPGGNDMVDPGDEQVGEDLTATSLTVNNQPDGTYNYLVVATGATSGSSSTKASDEVTVPGTATATGAPKSENATLRDDNNGALPVTAPGETWRFAFDKPLASPASSASLLVVDGNLADFVVKQGSSTDANAQFSLNGGTVTIAGKQYAPGHVLSIDIVFPVNNGETPAEYPFTVIDSNGLQGSNGSAILPGDWAASFDRVIEHDAAAPTSESACVIDTGTAGVSVNDQIVIDFSSSMEDATTASTPPRPLPEKVTIRFFGGATLTLTNAASSSTWSYGDGDGDDDDDDVLTITIKGNPAASQYNGSTLESPVFIIDTSGHEWNIGSGSSDKALDAC